MITTCRNASAGTRRAAKRLAAEAGARYVARGKKTMDMLASDARRLGEEEICVLEERGGRPRAIAMASVDELGAWRWKGERLLNPAAEEEGKEGLH